MTDSNGAVLIAGFTVSRRGGRFAPMAISYLVDLWSAEPAGVVPPDDYIDFSVNRPYVRWLDDKSVLDWPEAKFFHSPAAAAGREVLFLAGPEPNFHWQRFCDAILARAVETGAKTLLLVRGYAAAVPHTRPAPIFITCTDPVLASQFRCPNASFKNDTPGDVGHALTTMAAARGIATVDVHLLLPEYVRPMPRGGAFLTLTRLIDTFTGRTSDTSALESAIEQERATVDEYVRLDQHLAGQIRALEDKHDGGNDWAAEVTGDEPSPPPAEPDLPPGNEVADQIERFFRERDR